MIRHFFFLKYWTDRLYPCTTVILYEFSLQLYRFKKNRKKISDGPGGVKGQRSETPIEPALRTKIMCFFGCKEVIRLAFTINLGNHKFGMRWLLPSHCQHRKCRLPAPEMASIGAESGLFWLQVVV